MIEVRIPVIGESITTVFLAKWLVKPGDAVIEGQSLASLDSDKASMEVPSPGTGVLAESLVAEGSEVAVGAVIARIDPVGTARPAASAPAAVAAPAGEPVGEVRAGPAARHEAHERGVALDSVPGTGPRGRVTSADVRSLAAGPAPAPAAAPASAPSAAPARVTPPRPEPSARTERVPMSPLRRTIARRLVEAQQTAAMLTTFNEVDMTAILELRKKHQDAFTARHGVKLGFMSFFVKAAIEALKEFPAVNAEIDGTDLVYKNYYNIGVAVSGPRGLVVPVVRDADRLSFAATEKAIAELATRAKDNKLAVADFEDGTFTISNGGVFGSMMSTPILNPPQVGILGMHAILQRPIGVDGAVVLRPMMYLALSYDHRIIDGREAVSFLVRIKQLVEAPERILLEA